MNQPVLIELPRQAKACLYQALTRKIRKGQEIPGDAK
jgi:hypothetical protein